MSTIIICPRSGNFCTQTGCNKDYFVCEQLPSIATDRTEFESSEPQEKFKCAHCGTEMNEGERDTFTVCDPCFDKHYSQSFLIPKVAPSESQEEPETPDDGTRPQEPQENIWKEIIFACREARNPSYEELQNWFQKNYLITRNL